MNLEEIKKGRTYNYSTPEFEGFGIVQSKNEEQGTVLVAPKGYNADSSEIELASGFIFPRTRADAMKSAWESRRALKPEPIVEDIQSQEQTLVEDDQSGPPQVEFKLYDDTGPGSYEVVG